MMPCLLASKMTTSNVDDANGSLPVPGRHPFRQRVARVSSSWSCKRVRLLCDSVFHPFHLPFDVDRKSCALACCPLPAWPTLVRATKYPCGRIAQRRFEHRTNDAFHCIACKLECRTSPMPILDCSRRNHSTGCCPEAIPRGVGSGEGIWRPCADKYPAWTRVPRQRG